MERRNYAVPDDVSRSAGVVDALHRLARRGFTELRRDYVPYLDRSFEVQSDFPDEDPERSLWMGETGIRLVLQRIAPSRANLERSLS